MVVGGRVGGGMEGGAGGECLQSAIDIQEDFFFFFFFFLAFLQREERERVWRGKRESI